MVKRILLFLFITATAIYSQGSGYYYNSGNSLGTSNSMSVALGDVNGDTYIDAVVANENQAQVVYTNDGSGNFSSFDTFGGGNSQSIKLGDVDGDGDLDVLSASSSDHKIAWYENRAEGVRLQAKVFLEGPYDAAGDSMSTAVNDSLPKTSPYAEDARTVGSIPSTITDWVLVELRSTADGSAIISRSALLRKDGKIVDDDGTTEYITMNVNPGDYFIAVRHRNHLAVMSDEVHALATESSTLYDFTADASIAYDKYYGGDAAILETNGTTIYGMYGGETNDTGTVTTADKAPIVDELNESGYYDADANFSGTVTTADKALIVDNLNKSTNVP